MRNHGWKDDGKVHAARALASVLISQLESELGKCESLQKLYECCEVLQRALGYEHFLYVLSFDEDMASGRQFETFSNWPTFPLSLLTKSFSEAGFALAGFIGENAVPKPETFDISYLLRVLGGRRNQLMKLLMNAQLDSGVGICLPPSALRDKPGLLILSGASPSQDPPPNLYEIGAKVLDKYEVLKQDGYPASQKLSKRELECLQWTSEGKTSYEIGVILGLSENTINNYIATVGRKLGSVNRAHMVGIALREGLIN